MTTESSDWVAEHEARKNWVNKLFYGDNLDVLRDRLAPETVDLVYLDPPFNSNRSYNVLFGHKRSPDDRAQIEAFDDTWTWTQETERLYFDLINGGCRRGHRDLRSAGSALEFGVLVKTPPGRSSAGSHRRGRSLPTSGDVRSSSGRA